MSRSATVRRWRGWPPLAALQAAAAEKGRQDWIIETDRLPENGLYPHAHDAGWYAHWLAALQRLRGLYAAQNVLCLPDILPGIRLLVVRPEAAAQHAQAADAPPRQPWLAVPHQPLPDAVLVIGAGIAGAATAYALARRGIEVCVVDKNAAAAAASGNRQGLLYAKISPHPTVQTELLLAGYAYSRHLLAQTLPENQGWQACGVLHVNHSDSETRRNRALGEQTPNPELFRTVGREEAGRLAGMDVPAGGLWWPQGAAVHPPAWAAALLRHPRIRLYEHTHINSLDWHNEHWHLHAQTPSGSLKLAATHVVLCAGADSGTLPLLASWPKLQSIRGQTTVLPATPTAQKLRCAVSGQSYASPSWDNLLCFGATFYPGSRDTSVTAADHAENLRHLSQLLPPLALELDETAHQNIGGHAALRCDAYDHLPVVGALPDAAAMYRLYAKLAQDKNFRYTTPCPFLPNAYINTAHGSRGLATAPLCGEAVAAMMMHETLPWSARLQYALHPGRLPVHKLVYAGRATKTSE